VSEPTITPDGTVPDDGSESGTPGRRLPLAPFVVAALAVLAGLLFWVLISADGNRTATAQTPLMDQPAPAAVGTLEDGAPFELSRRKGSWVVLNFFTHDCIPCIQEQPELIDFVAQQRTLGSQGAEFYSVVQSSTRDEVAEYFDTYGGDWPVVYDDEYDFQLEFGVVQVPETWIIDPNGIVRGRVIGEVEADLLSASIQALRERFSAAGGGLG
jgi:cytochrome c biogenesis protein CcmG/thiol:disulfide interchange protein DsbE